MARPINANADETKRRILTAASQLFADGGFEGTSVRQIAAGADVSLGMIRHYFGSKDGLYQACLASAWSIYERVGAAIDEGLGAGGDPTEVLASTVRQAYRFALEQREALRLVMWTQLERSEAATPTNRTVMVPFIQRTAEVLAERTGQAPAHLALTLRTLVMTVTRYGITDVEELAALVGVDASDTERVFQAVEDHLVALTHRLLA